MRLMCVGSTARDHRTKPNLDKSVVPDDVPDAAILSKRPADPAVHKDRAGESALWACWVWHDGDEERRRYI